MCVRWFKIACLSVMSLLLAGCSLSPVATPHVSTYFLHPVMKEKSVEPAQTINASVTVLPIDSAPAYANTAMHYVLTPFQLQSFATHRWVSPPAAMWQPWLVDALRQAGIATVVSAPTGAQTKYSVQVYLNQFEQNFQRPQSAFIMAATAELLDNSTGKVVAVKSFHVQIAAQTNDPYGGVVAANMAVASLDKQLASFVAAGI